MSTKAFELVYSLERNVLLLDIRGEAHRAGTTTSTVEVSISAPRKFLFCGQHGEHPTTVNKD